MQHTGAFLSALKWLVFVHMEGAFIGKNLIVLARSVVMAVAHQEETLLLPQELELVQDVCGIINMNGHACMDKVTDKKRTDLCKIKVRRDTIKVLLARI